MRYRKLELLLISVGLVAVIISILVSFLNGAGANDVLGQALFVPVLVFAVHKGRTYGYLSAVFAALLLLIIKTSELGALDFTTIESRRIVLQTVAYGIVGIIGGELAARMKYLIAKMADENFIDTGTNVFSHDYIDKLILRSLQNYKRYGHTFSMILVEASWSKPQTQSISGRQLSRVADIIRSNVRLIDEVGFVGQGRFCILLPSTPHDDALVARRRLQKILDHSKQFSRITANLSERVLCVPDDQNEIEALAGGSSEKVTA